MEKTEIRFFAHQLDSKSGHKELKGLSDAMSTFCTDREQIAKMLPNMIGMMNSIQMQVCQGKDGYPFILVMIVSMAQVAPGRIQ